jgi:hypothetical protein
MRRSITLMALVALASIATLGSAAPAKAQGQACDKWTVSYRNIERGYLAGCFFEKYHYPLDLPYVDGAFDVCDYVNEPQETNIVRAQVMVAFSDNRRPNPNYVYYDSPWYSAPGDGTGCFSNRGFFMAGPQGWFAKYVRITVQAPGKSTQQYWASFVF